MFETCAELSTSFNALAGSLSINYETCHHSARICARQTTHRVQCISQCFLQVIRRRLRTKKCNAQKILAKTSEMLQLLFLFITNILPMASASTKKNFVLCFGRWCSKLLSLSLSCVAHTRRELTVRNRRRLGNNQPCCAQLCTKLARAQQHKHCTLSVRDDAEATTERSH